MLVRARSQRRGETLPSPGETLARSKALCVSRQHGRGTGSRALGKVDRLPFGWPRREQAPRVPASPTRGKLDSCRRPQGSRCLSLARHATHAVSPPSALRRMSCHVMPCLHARVSVSHACVPVKNANGRQRDLCNERVCCSSGGRSASRSPCAGCTGSRVNADRQHACTCDSSR